MSAEMPDAERAGEGAGDRMAHGAVAVGRSPIFGWLVRVGFAGRAITYAVIGVLAIALAAGAGSSSGTPNQEGALTVIADAPLGKALLVVIAVGLLAYALWKLGRAVAGGGPDGGGGSRAKDRIADGAGGLAYLAFFSLAVRVLVATAGSEDAQQRRATAGVLGWPGGRLIVGAGGAVLIAISLQQIRDAIKARFVTDNKLEQMEPAQRRVFLVLGRVGLIARSLVFGLIGYFVLRTAIVLRVQSGIGLDGALAQLHHQPAGEILLGVVAAGLVIFAAFSSYEARYQRL